MSLLPSVVLKSKGDQFRENSAGEAEKGQKAQKGEERAQLSGVAMLPPPKGKSSLSEGGEREFRAGVAPRPPPLAGGG